MTGRIAPVLRGAAVFAANCVACHGADGKGLRAFGAPNLADQVWLYGGTKEQVAASIAKARAGVMPAWGGKLDPVIGRDDEIRRTIQVLQRRTKNNPVIIGEPGVGKTAIAEGLALRIIQKKVSRVLFDKRVVSLDIASIIMNRFYRIQLAGQLRPLYGTDNAIAVKNGSFKENNGTTTDFRIVVLPFTAKLRMVYVQSQDFLVSAVLPMAKIQPVLSDMLIVLRNAKAQSNDVVNLFSNKVVVDYDRISKELIEFIAPESGTIVDMLKLITGDFDFDETLPDDYYDDDVIEIPVEEPNEEGEEDVEGVE